MSLEKEIKVTQAPRIVEERILEKLESQLKEELKGKLEIDYDVFFNTYRLLPPSDQTKDDWSVIAYSIIRIIPRKGCDQIKVLSIKEIYANFKISWRFNFVTLVKTAYFPSSDILIIANLPTVISVINSTICPICLLHKNNCKCSEIKEQPLEHFDFDISDYQGSLFIPNQPIIKSELDEFSYKESPLPEADFGKFDSIIAGIAKTMRLKSLVKIREKAHTIIAQNPEISEEQLAKELLKNGILT